MPPNLNDWGDLLKGSEWKIFKNWIKIRIFFLFFRLNRYIKKKRMLAKNKYYVRKKHGPKPYGMNLPDESSISSRKIITMKMRQNLGHFGTNRVKVVIARYRFSSDIVKTLRIYYVIILECMCEVSKLLTIQIPRKLTLTKNFKKRLNTEFPCHAKIFN